jgi:hypothetical protein
MAQRAGTSPSRLKAGTSAPALDPVEVYEHVPDGSLHVAVPESAQDFFCPRHDGQLRCDVLEKFPAEPSRQEAGDVQHSLQLLVGEGERGHGPEAGPAAPVGDRPPQEAGDIWNPWKKS